MLRRFSRGSGKGVCYFYDDFVGSLYDNRTWSVRGTGGSVTTLSEGIVRVRSNAMNNYEMYHGDNPDFSVVANIVHTSRWRVSSTTNMAGGVGLEAASPDHTNNQICFKFDTDVGTNLLAYSSSAGSSTVVDTGVASATSFKEFRISCTSSTLTYFIGGTLVATITTNIPQMLLQPYCFIEAKIGATRDVLFDFIEVYGERES